MGPINYLYQKYPFSFRTLKTHHLCDVSATEVEVLLHSLHVYGLSPVWALSTIYIKNTHFRSELSKHTTCVMFQQQKLEVLLHSLHVYGLSPVWALLTTYIKNAHFSFRTLKTHHLCDVSATEVGSFVALLARVWVISSMGPINYLYQKCPFFV